ncbi:Uncharacterised protein [Citrobacter youngae]|uniref:Uncharacterized protein n=1 Tax=Citrobacter youngae TaxID=133448 RepID=A0ABN7GI00_9ENTR|nr:Uncharacterised protein [Citrobacter youngae]CAC9106171.1 Uncharacterised protein [Citrobacter youngae]
MVYGCGFVSSDKMSVAGIREIAFHHSHASLLKHTARSTKRQSKGKKDGGFWPPVSVSILIFFFSITARYRAGVLHPVQG